MIYKDLYNLFKNMSKEDILMYLNNKINEKKVYNLRYKNISNKKIELLGITQLDNKDLTEFEKEYPKLNPVLYALVSMHPNDISSIIIDQCMRDKKGKLTKAGMDCYNLLTDKSLSVVVNSEQNDIVVFEIMDRNKVFFRLDVGVSDIITISKSSYRVYNKYINFNNEIRNKKLKDLMEELEKN